MKIITRAIQWQTISIFIISIICLSSFSSAASAFSKEELLDYRDSVKDIVEESMLKLKPGTLKSGKVTREEKQKLMVAMVKSMNSASNTMLYDTLSYYSIVFKECAKRLEHEVYVNDPVLSEWHKKLTAGYKDSWKISEDTLKAMKTSDNAGVEMALSDKQLMQRIRDNQTYHRKIQNELENLIKSVLSGDPDVRSFSRELTSMYVETTWK